MFMSIYYLFDSNETETIKMKIDRRNKEKKKKCYKIKIYEMFEKGEKENV